MRAATQLLTIAALAGWAAHGGLGAHPKAVHPASFTLRYFDYRGLAEPIRLTLAMLRIDYDEVSRRCVGVRAGVRARACVRVRA